MTDEKVALFELIEKADGDVVREMLAFAAERLMACEVTALTGAGHGQRSPDRLTHRNGYRQRSWDTRAGRIELAIPKLRQGSYFPSFLEPRRTAESEPAPPRFEGRANADGRDPGSLCAWRLDPGRR